MGPPLNSIHFSGDIWRRDATTGLLAGRPGRSLLLLGLSQLPRTQAVLADRLADCCGLPIRGRQIRRVGGSLSSPTWERACALSSAPCSLERGIALQP